MESSITRSSSFVLRKVGMASVLSMSESTLLTDEPPLTDEAAEGKGLRVGELARPMLLANQHACLRHHRVISAVEAAHIEFFGRSFKECAHDEVIVNTIVQEADALGVPCPLPEEVDSLRLDIECGNLGLEVRRQNSELDATTPALLLEDPAHILRSRLTQHSLRVGFTVCEYHISDNTAQAVSTFAAAGSAIQGMCDRSKQA
mmetsp:Transcript_63294/g.125086  ORF Transcript_63294/g.125086 Transcript_63294/m.125086 type:complete len:203 (-) Transcript_63294:525-1133(-)